SHSGLPAPCARGPTAPACAAPARDSETSPARTPRECTHPPCSLRHQCRRQRDRLVPSSTPFLAWSGLEAHATVRVEEDTGSVPSPSGSQPLSTNGLRSSDGRLVDSRPFAHSARFFGHKSTKETVKTIARGMPGESGVTVVTMLVCFFILHARLRAHRAPGIPCALIFSGRKIHASLGRFARRECGGVALTRYVSQG